MACNGRRGDLFKKRRGLMAQWERFIEGRTPDVVPMEPGRKRA